MFLDADPLLPDERCHAGSLIAEDSLDSQWQPAFDMESYVADLEQAETATTNDMLTSAVLDRVRAPKPSSLMAQVIVPADTFGYSQPGSVLGQQAVEQGR